MEKEPVKREQPRRGYALPRAPHGERSRSYGSIRIIDHGVTGVVGEEAAVVIGEIEATVDPVVDGGLDGD